jgi:hypothetical protein
MGSIQCLGCRNTVSLHATGRWSDVLILSMLLYSSTRNTAPFSLPPPRALVYRTRSCNWPPSPRSAHRVPTFSKPGKLRLKSRLLTTYDVRLTPHESDQDFSLLTTPRTHPPIKTPVRLGQHAAVSENQTPNRTLRCVEISCLANMCIIISTVLRLVGGVHRSAYLS